MSPIDIAIGLLVGLLAFWLLGGLVARLGGLLLVLAGVANLTLEPRVEASLLIRVGALALRALRHQGIQEPAGPLRLLSLGSGLARPGSELGASAGGS